MNEQHIAELAELYALGSLDAADEAVVHAHIRTCTECARRVQDAEDAVTALAQTLPLQTPSRALDNRFRRPLRPAFRFTGFASGLAAGIVLAVLVALPGYFASQTRTQTTDVALSALVLSHFGHVPFVKVQSGAPDAKLIYGRKREWLYAVVHGSLALHVGLQRGATITDVGPLVASGANAVRFVAAPPAFDTVVLLRDGVVSETAQPPPGK